MIDVAILTDLPFTVPPATKVLAATAAIYTILQLAKKVPAFTQYLTGWVAIAINVALGVVSIFIPPSTITAANLYTMSTLTMVLQAGMEALTTSMAAAGIHGTLKSMSAPQVLATIPPSTQVVEVPATLTPVDPKAVVADPKK